MFIFNDAEYQTKLGERLTALRGVNNRRETSAQMGISEQSLCRYEKGGRKPDLLTAKRIADYYKVSLDELFDENYEKGEEDDVLHISSMTGLSIKSIKMIIDNSNDELYMKKLNYFIESGEIESIIFALTALESISKSVLNFNKSPNYIKHFSEDKTIDILDNALKILNSIVDESDASINQKSDPSELEKYTHFLREQFLTDANEDVEHVDLD
ncbi:MAG TPA: helix-turn-helix transcriptional regulator [Ruminococcus sp.]|nr:helix-turn-helix transcriptional regulator [Ruminococcus sp.]